MNKFEFTNLLQNTQHINAQQTNQIKEILEEFPFFQSARAIYLKGLKNEDNYKYNNELKVTATHTTDRSVLFDFITSAVFNQQLISKNQQQLQQQISDIEVIDAETITTFISETNDFDEDVLKPDLFKEKNNINNDAIISDNLEIKKPLSFNKSETHSFQEWLQLSSVKPIERDSEEVILIDIKPTKIDLIDKFIANKPKIKPVKKTVNLKNLATQNSFSSEELMTETLAKVYLAQNNYKKAKQAYRILSLKYPEKSSFFVVRISEIEKLEKNNTK